MTNTNLEPDSTQDQVVLRRQAAQIEAMKNHHRLQLESIRKHQEAQLERMQRQHASELMALNNRLHPTAAEPPAIQIPQSHLHG